MKLGELLTIEQNIITLLIDEILTQNINQYLSVTINQYLSVHKKSSYFIFDVCRQIEIRHKIYIKSIYIF